MEENVGNKDRLVRSVAGPVLMGVGYFLLGGKEGKIGGIATIVAGTAVAQSALTRVCPANASLGIDTREKKKKGTIGKIKDVLP